jgi:hypothetical protein
MLLKERSRNDLDQYWIAASEITTTTAFYKSHIVSTVHHARTEADSRPHCFSTCESCNDSSVIEYHGDLTKSVAGALETILTVSEGVSSMNRNGILIL